MDNIVCRVKLDVGAIANMKFFCICPGRILILFAISSFSDLLRHQLLIIILLLGLTLLEIFR
jgi:hypothetical protein